MPVAMNFLSDSIHCSLLPHIAIESNIASLTSLVALSRPCVKYSEVILFTSLLKPLLDKNTL